MGWARSGGTAGSATSGAAFERLASVGDSPHRAGRRGRTILIWVLLGFPTWLALIYFPFVASDQFESETRFVVKSAARPSIPAGLSLLTQLGLARSQEDSFAVQDFMRSRDAIARLRALMPIERMFGAAHADFLARFPSILYRAREESFYDYFQNMVTVIHSEPTGVTSLRVRAFEAPDARNIATALLGLGEELVNRMNVRARADAVRVAQSDLELSQQRLIDAQLALTEFRNRELIVDPQSNAVALAELISGLSAELATTRAQIREMAAGSAASPQLPGLRRKEAALEQQIVQERARIGRDSGGLANRIADYERLILAREFANRHLTAAETELVRAREEAARQQLYLERVVEPNLPDYATQPKRLRLIATVFIANVLLLLVGWLVYSGVREHVAE